MTSPDFEDKQIFIAHESLWKAMEAFAERNNFYLAKIPTVVDGQLTLNYPEDKTPTYAFMPKMAGD